METKDGALLYPHVYKEVKYHVTHKNGLSAGIFTKRSDAEKKAQEINGAVHKYK